MKFTIIGIPVIPPSSKDDEIAAWVIIVPIVIGVLVIIFIVVCLYFVSPPLTFAFLCIYNIYLLLLVGFLQTKEGR